MSQPLNLKPRLACVAASGDVLYLEDGRAAIPVDPWPVPFTGALYEVTCRNHQKSRYLTKGPGRSLHFVDGDPRFGGFTECPCPYSDLVVIVDADDEA